MHRWSGQHCTFTQTGIADDDVQAACGIGRVGGLAHHRQDPDSVLAGRLRDELLEPQPDRLEPCVDQERELVPAVLRGDGHERAELCPEVVLDRGVGAERLGRLLSGVQQVGAVEPHQRSGHHAEGREGREPSADLRNAVGDESELPLGR